MTFERFFPLAAMQMGRLLFQAFRCSCPVILVIYLYQTTNFPYFTADRINRRDEGLITISDSSDEESPSLETPAEQQHEEDDDDVVVVAEVIFHSCTCPALFMAFPVDSCVNI